MGEFSLQLEQARASRDNLHAISNHLGNIHVHAGNARQAALEIIFISEHGLKVAILTVLMHDLEDHRGPWRLATRILQEQCRRAGGVIWMHESEPD